MFVTWNAQLIGFSEKVIPKNLLIFEKVNNLNLLSIITLDNPFFSKL